MNHRYLERRGLSIRDWRYLRKPCWGGDSKLTLIPILIYSCHKHSAFQRCLQHLISTAEFKVCESGRENEVALGPATEMALMPRGSPATRRLRDQASSGRRLGALEPPGCEQRHQRWSGSAPGRYRDVIQRFGSTGPRGSL
jgi:hypothetical protein